MSGFLNFLLPWLTSPAQWSGQDGVPNRVSEHIFYTVLALAVAMLLALPAGMFTGHTGRGGFLAASLANFARALPTIGLLVIIVQGMGIGLVPPLIVLVALAIPPILINTYEGIRSVDAEMKDAARGVGMTGRQVLFRVELPAAMPLILLGLRTAAIQIVATATVAAYVGLGGLGRFIFDGLSRQDYQALAGGTVFAVLLALVVTLVFMLLRRLLVPRGVRLQEKA
ncbi:MAG TPA: ABC transporter permease [Streptosporangiaceae bacterium]|jgi:osmoprotectant transport system permease protein